MRLNVKGVAISHPTTYLPHYAMGLGAHAAMQVAWRYFRLSHVRLILKKVKDDL